MTEINVFGFDSAWTDNPRKPGAICAWRGATAAFVPPVMGGFDAAYEMIAGLHRPDDLTLIAIDQPTIVPNATGARAVERVVGGTISWSGGGMQPAYRGKASMFGDDAPIWRFLDCLAALGCLDDPERAATATSGLFVMEVYPALALLSLDPAFTEGRGRRPSYNPANRRKYRPLDWQSVCAAVVAEARRFGLEDAASFSDAMGRLDAPRKADQDRLDAVICLLVGKRWREDRSSCVMVGDLAAGYVVAPAEPIIRDRLRSRANLLGVAYR